MALTITPQFSTTGRAATQPVYCVAEKPLQIGIYDITLDDSYPTNGESVSSIMANYDTVLYVGLEQKDTNTASDFRILRYDYTNQVIVVYADGDATPAEAANESDQSAVAIRMLVVGYAL